MKRLTIVVSNDQIGERLSKMCRGVKERLFIATWSLGPRISKGPLAPLFEAKRKTMPPEMDIVLDFNFQWGPHLNSQSIRELFEVFGREHVKAPRDGTHAKLYVADGQAIVASANLANNALEGKGSWEVGVYTTDEHLVAKVVDAFRAIRDGSLPVSDEELESLEKLENEYKDVKLPRFVRPAPEVRGLRPKGFPATDFRQPEPLEVPNSKMKKTTARFRSRMGEMASFQEPSKLYLAGELNIKITPAIAARDLFVFKSLQMRPAQQVMEVFGTNIVGTSSKLLDWRSREPWKKVVLKLCSDNELAGKVVDALADAVHGDSDEGGKLDRYLRCVREARKAVGATTGDWTWFTLPLFLIKPDCHLYVRPGVFELFFRDWIRVPDLCSLRGRCSADLYLRLRDTALRLGAALAKHGMEPLDMIDVQSFIWVVGRKKWV